MRPKWGALFVTLLCLGLMGPAAFAHHGTAAYDTTSRITLKGTVTQFLWANPHTQILFDVKDDKGAITHWSSETFAPGKLVHMGWTKDCLKPGDPITVTLNPAKNGTPVGYLLKVVTDDGKEFGTQESQP